MQSAVLILLVAAASVSASSVFEVLKLQKRQAGALGTGAGGLVGAGVGIVGTNEQNAICAQDMCSAANCQASNTQINSASGSGALLGLGQGIGNIGAPINLCPSICLACPNIQGVNAGK